MVRFFLISFNLLLFISTYSQNLENIKLLHFVDTVEKYHIGYKYFYTHSLQYQKFKAKLLKNESKLQALPFEFAALTYLNFFKDNHSTFYTSNPNVNSFKLKNESIINQDLVGLWKDCYSKRLFKIDKKSNGDFCFVQYGSSDSLKIVRYSIGEFSTVFEFKKRYYIRGYSLKNGVIFLKGKPFLIKIKNDYTKYIKQSSVFDGFSQKKLNDSTYLLRIGALRVNYIKTYDSIINSIHSELENSKIIIIDLRDCPGGTVNVLEPLFKYINDGNSISYLEGYTLPTEESINDRKVSFQSLKAILTTKDSLGLLESISNDEYNINKIYLPKRKPLILGNTINGVKSIFILQNRQTSSSGELFILAVCNSKKVITIGENTKGIVDYADGKFLEWDGIGVNLSICMVDHLPKKSYETIGIAPNILFDDINNLDNTIKFLLK